MSRRIPGVLVLAASLGFAVGACQSSSPSSAPALTDPKEIVTAGLKATEGAKSVHVDVMLDGTVSVALPIGGGTATPVNVTGTTASADVDFAKPAARAVFAVPAMLGLAGEVIAVDGKSYIKTTITGPLYQESATSSAPLDPSAAGGVVDNLDALLTKEGIVLTKGDDVACGSKQCYTVSADLSADQLGTSSGSLAGLPVDLTGASVALTMRVEKDAPNHLAGVDAVVTMKDGTKLTINLTASKWDQPVTVTAPPADQVKPAAS
ncbi:MAG: LppX_LprAFG lipoprotein [Chloroflexota bacterium]